eukprot:7765700-Lingulodinium_polyedra.AAC.1
MEKLKDSDLTSKEDMKLAELLAQFSTLLPYESEVASIELLKQLKAKKTKDLSKLTGKTKRGQSSKSAGSSMMDEATRAALDLFSA